MATVTDFASAAAAQSAGWRLVQLDRGAGKSPRFESQFQKPYTGAGGSGGLQTHTGQSDASAAAADTQALTALNAYRRHRYGGSPGRASGSNDSPDHLGNTHTLDVT
jgi:hypothetical protein